MVLTHIEFVKRPLVIVCCASILLSACNSRPEDPLRAEREKLEAEKAALVAEKTRIAAEQELAQRKAANTAEADRLAQERAKFEADKERHAQDQAKLDKERAEQALLEKVTKPEERLQMERNAELDAATAQVAAERRRLDALKTQAEADRLAAERAAMEAKAREFAAKRAEAEAASQRTVSFFYDALASHGRWYETDRYGFVWQPKRAAVDRDWRPYTDGRWQWTEYGWTWQSLEPYGWAVYHYGRWFRQPGVGWLWAPSHEWAPAWVAWRVKGSGYVGWAPLPPDSRSGRNYGATVDRELEIAPVNYVFLDVKEFDQPTYVHRFIARDRQMEMLRGSRSVTRIERHPTHDGTIVVAGGPDPGMIASSIRQERNDPEARPVPQLNLVLAGKPSEKVTGDVVESGAMMLFAPKLEKAAPASKPKEVEKALRVSERENGWSDTNPEHETEWRSMVDREAAYAAAAEAAAKNPPKPAAQSSRSGNVRPTPTPTPKPQVRSTPSAPARPNPLNPSRLEPAKNLFDR